VATGVRVRRVWIQLVVLAALAVAVASVPGGAAATTAPRPRAITVTRLGQPDGDTPFAPIEINERGQMMGTSVSATNPGGQVVFYNRGRFTKLTEPLGTYDLIGARSELNERGEVAGSVASWAGTVSTFLWSQGRRVDLDEVWLQGLTDRGQLVLTRNVPRGTPEARPFVWDDGRVVRSPATPAGTDFQITAVGPTGLVGGYFEAFEPGVTPPAGVWIWRPGDDDFIPVGSLGGGSTYIKVITADQPGRRRGGTLPGLHLATRPRDH
jgi:hypothetical protein